MTRHPVTTPLLVLLCAVALQGCATGPDVFQRHTAAMDRRAAEEALPERAMCPVIVDNATDLLLDVRYEASGVPAGVGILPAGQRVQVEVECSAGSVQARGTSVMGSTFEEGTEFEARARLDPIDVAVLQFTMNSASR